jgi:hypothetical protein
VGKQEVAKTPSQPETGHRMIIVPYRGEMHQSTTQDRIGLGLLASLSGLALDPAYCGPLKSADKASALLLIMTIIQQYTTLLSDTPLL